VGAARSYRFTVSSRLAAPRGAVWERVSSMEGVNDELAPLVRMTYPATVADLGEADVPLGERLFRSWLLLFGVVPFDYDDLVLVRVEAGRGFLERSSMLSQRVWEHERTLEDAPGGCLVTDRIRYEPRLPGLGRLLRPLLRRFFAHRHRRLRRRFGGEPVAPA
jgi:ligand-binding SRPBCC domain-containing protein